MSFKEFKKKNVDLLKKNYSEIGDMVAYIVHELNLNLKIEYGQILTERFSGYGFNVSYEKDNIKDEISHFDLKACLEEIINPSL